MPSFKTRTRLSRKQKEKITRKTVLLGVFTVFLVVILAVWGLPFLVRLALFLGDVKKDNGSTDSIEETIPPLPPRLFLPFEATNSSLIKVTGVSEKGLEIELIQNDRPVTKIVAGEEGGFEFRSIDLSAGENYFLAFSTNEQGQISQPSEELLVIYDNEAPELEMTAPSEESIKVEETDYTVTGRTEEGVSVTVKGRVAIVNSDGSFKVRVPLSEGENQVEVVATDMAGNVTKREYKITLVF